MSKYQVLPLHSLFEIAQWLNQPLDGEEPLNEQEIYQLTIEYLEEEGMKRTKPVFNRNGYYYDRIENKCWHEWEGTAWIGSVKDFKYDMASLENRILEPAEVEAIKTLMVYGSCPRELKDKLYWHNSKIMLRNIGRSSHVWHLLKKC